MSPQSRFLLTAATGLGLAATLMAEKPRIATFDAAVAFESYHVAKAERTKVGEAKKKLASDPRVEQLKLTRVELLELRDKVRDTSLPEDARQEYFRKFQMKAHELNSLRRDITNSREEQTKAIDEAMVKKTKELLGTINATVQKVATAEGFDMVFEKGGTTSSQVSTLVYVRDATDITQQVIKELNRDAPVEKEVATTNKAVPAP